MDIQKKIVAIIPARGGSKGIPKKNIKLLAGKPLIAWTIEQAKSSKYIEEIYVSTDDPVIAEISKLYGAKVIERPAEFATDAASSESVLLHFAEQVDFDVLVFLHCTSPLRYPYQIDEAIGAFIKDGADSLLTGYTNDSFLWDGKGNSINYDFRNRPNRQDKEWEFVENGSFYITSKENLLRERNFLGGKIHHYLMPKWMSFEIDEPFDFELIEILMNKKYGKEDLENGRE
ncbi:MAG: acylneuraminate cytidylyltransferase family protein [Patescibacteria group bacterium]